MSYVLPQVKVFQEFRVLPAAVTQNLNAFVFGPNYQLVRYAEDAERANGYLGAYDPDNDTAYAYPNQAGGSTIDLDYVKLFMEDVLAQYAVIPESLVTPITIPSNTERNKLRGPDFVFAAGNGSIPTAAEFKTRGVKVGDRIRYAVTDDLSAVHTGMTKVVGFEAEEIAAVVAAAEMNAANAASQIAASAAPVATAGNLRDFDGVGTATAFVGGVASFPGDSAAGVIDDVYTVEITTPGFAGTALATVSNDSGTYIRTGVPIEIDGVTDGSIYIGGGMLASFVVGVGDADAEFQTGDTFTVTVDTEFTAIAPADIVTGGTYTGTKDTTYVAEVIRGGTFTRSVVTSAGVNSATTAVLSASLNFNDWTGGDTNDEYVLTCTVPGGDLATARFALTSQNGDSEIGIQLAAASDTSIGNRGLEAQFNVDDVFALGDSWVIQVRGARPQLRIYDSAGSDSSSTVVVEDGVAVPLGDNGATANFNVNVNTEGGLSLDGSLLKGDVFHIPVTAVGEGALSTLILADDVPTEVNDGNEFSLWFYLVQSSTEIDDKKVQLPPDYNFEAAAADVTVNQDIEVQDATWVETDGSLPWLPVYSSELYVQYRALLSTHVDTIQNLTDIGDITTVLGTIDPDNPLAQGAYHSLLNSGDQGIYFAAVATDDLAGYLSVLDRATLSEDVYGLAPLTQDATILDAVISHADDMSSEENKRWRIAFVGTEMATEAAVYDLAKNPSGEEYFATITDDVTAGEYTFVQLLEPSGASYVPSTITAALTEVVPGDRLQIVFATDAWGDQTYEEYVVAQVLTNSTLLLEQGPAAAITLPLKTEVHHDYSVQEMADGVAATSASFANRRAYHVFPSRLGTSDGVVDSSIAAAAVAGLNSSVVPQQGLTTIELAGFTDLPLVYSTFNRTQLNKMAEYGTMIIMQDIAGGEIYIRHQVSTASQEGNINTRELSVTKNLDSISYYFAARLRPYIGRFNITPELLDVLDTQIRDGLQFLGGTTSVGLLGPQVLLDETELVGVEQHPTLLDHVVAVVNLRLPYPLNVIELHLVV